MIIVSSASQPFVLLCLMGGGIIYSAFCYIVSRLDINSLINNIINCITTVLGAMVYFTILFIVNHGEMRLYTLIAFVGGWYIGYKLLNKVLGKEIKKP